jgi:alcohol dehydrogenase class IV
VNFELATAGRVVVGAGTAAQLAPALADILRGAPGRTVLVVSGRNRERIAPLLAALAASGITPISFGVSDEPTVDLAREGVRRVAETGAAAVVAIGGGSALDAGKAIAALAPGGSDPMEHLEVVGAGRPIDRPPLPFIAIPTTAGTGSEVTRNAVLAVPEARVKASLRSPMMLPRLAIVDPELLAGLPPAVIASSGLDALSQVIEPFLSVRANPITDALARDAIRRSARALGSAYRDGLSGDDRAAAREDLALASLCGGLCLANAGLGAVHGFAAPAGGMFGAPHGAVCAALLPPVLEVNLRALRARASDHPALARMEELAALLTGAARGDVRAEDGITFVSDLARTLQVRGLGAYGMTAADIPVLVEGARRASSMKGNPLSLTESELTEIAEKAF